MEARLGEKGKRECVQVLRLLGTVRAGGSRAGHRRCPADGDDLVRCSSSTCCCAPHRAASARLDLENYPHLPMAQVATTAAADYLARFGAC